MARRASDGMRAAGGHGVPVLCRIVAAGLMLVAGVSCRDPLAPVSVSRCILEYRIEGSVDTCELRPDGPVAFQVAPGEAFTVGVRFVHLATGRGVAGAKITANKYVRCSSSPTARCPYVSPASCVDSTRTARDGRASLACTAPAAPAGARYNVWLDCWDEASCSALFFSVEIVPARSLAPRTGP